MLVYPTAGACISNTQHVISIIISFVAWQVAMYRALSDVGDGNGHGTHCGGSAVGSFQSGEPPLPPPPFILPSPSPKLRLMSLRLIIHVCLHPFGLPLLSGSTVHCELLGFEIRVGLCEY